MLMDADSCGFLLGLTLKWTIRMGHEVVQHLTGCICALFWRHRGLKIILSSHNVHRFPENSTFSVCSFFQQHSACSLLLGLPLTRLEGENIRRQSHEVEHLSGSTVTSQRNILQSSKTQINTLWHMLAFIWWQKRCQNHSNTCEGVGIEVKMKPLRLSSTQGKSDLLATSEVEVEEEAVKIMSQ